MQTYEGEDGYLQLLRDVLNKGRDYPDRTGVGCRKLFDVNLDWQGDPISSVRPIGMKTAWREMRFFLQGETDTKKLEERGVYFWKGNTSREFLDNRGLTLLPEGSLGSAYSKQWRDAGGVDQLANLIGGLLQDPYSRRHAVDLWGVSEQDEMPILPCWYRWSFYVEEYFDEVWQQDLLKLHLKTFSRSCDLVFGNYYHSCQARMFQLALANLVEMEVGNLSHHILDAHIYSNQIDYVEELLSRKKGEVSGLKLLTEVGDLDILIHLPTSAFTWEVDKPNRTPFITPRPEMAV